MDPLLVHYFFREVHNDLLPFRESFWISNFLREFISNSLSFSQIYFQITIIFANSSRIYHLSRIFRRFEFIIFFTIYFQIIMSCTNYFEFHELLWIPRLRSLYFPESIFDSLSFSRIHFKITTAFTNLLSINYFLFDKFTLNYYLFREFNLNSVSFCEYTLNSLYIPEFVFNSISFSWIHFELTSLFANSLPIHYLFHELISNSQFFREFTFNLLSFSWIHFDFTFSVANSIQIPYLREFSSNSISVSRIEFQFTIYSANSLWFHYLFREITFNQLSFRRIHLAFPIIVKNKL